MKSLIKATMVGTLTFVALATFSRFTNINHHAARSTRQITASQTDADALSAQHSTLARMDSQDNISAFGIEEIQDGTTSCSCPAVTCNGPNFNPYGQQTAGGGPTAAACHATCPAPKQAMCTCAQANGGICVNQCYCR